MHLSKATQPRYSRDMQKISTFVFIWASLVFGALGIVFVLTLPGLHEQRSVLNIFVMKLIMATVFIILPSFALSVAAKYLNGKM
jgi:hypothetical protein